MLNILVPVMRRPQNAEPFMQSLRATCTEEEADVVAIYDADDTDTMMAWQDVMAAVLQCPVPAGTFPQKINHGFNHTDRPWVLLVGDDVQFHPNWYEAAVRCIQQSGCMVIGTNDLGNGAVTAGQHATHMIINRQYVMDLGASWDGPGVVCHEGYHHSYVDDEIVHAAKQRGTWASAHDSIVEHLHPGWGKSPHDEVYALGGSTMPIDAQLFHQRRATYYA